MRAPWRDLDDLVTVAERQAADLQTWPRYYRRRASEVDLALKLSKQPPVGRVLDVGCGSGFSTAALMTIAREAIGVDLPEQSAATHSVGMAKAEALFGRLGVSECPIHPGSAEDLPIEDRWADLVFAMYVLEHVPNRPRAMREFARVLRPGGRVVAMVPSFSDRLFAPLTHWSYLASRVAARVTGKQSIVHASEAAPGGNGQIVSAGAWSQIRQKNPNFPFPEPHGAYSSYWEELRAAQQRNWIRLFTDAGFEVESVFSTFLVPQTLLGALYGPLPFLVFDRTHGLHAKLGRTPVVRALGSCLGLAARLKSK